MNKDLIAEVIADLAELSGGRPRPSEERRETGEGLRPNSPQSRTPTSSARSDATW
jgi:hypothetical protein